MQRKILKVSLLLVLFGAGGFHHASNYAQDANEAERLLQKVIVLEDVDGDLQSAIKQYKAIIDGNGQNRPIAAQALFRLAGCYEKLGQKEAQKTYEQLIRDYPDQIDLVKVARAKLNLLEKGNTNLTVQLVWEGPEVELMGEASPDGRYICYTDWETGDLAIHDLVTGENRRLTGQKEWDGSFAEISRWSPDGKFIAYTWDTPGGIYGVRVVDLDDEKPRTLFPNGCVQDWSPDGLQLLVRNGWEDGLVSLVSVSDGSVQHLMKMGRADEEHDHMQFSPDGKYIAYDHQNVSISQGISYPTDKDIYLLSADGKIQIPLVKNPANDYLLGWTPDGRGILFASDRSGAVDAWVLPIQNGKPAGETRIVRKDIGGISPLGFTRDGRFFYGHGKDLRSIYIAAIDPKRGVMSATYKKLELPFEGRNGTAEFSPDGKRLAFIRESSQSGTGPGAITNNSLCIHDLETGEGKMFSLNLQVGVLRWAPDGSSILIGGTHERKVCVSNIDVLTGETTDIFPADKDVLEEICVYPDWSPDGSSVYCVRLIGAGEGDAQRTMIRKNIKTEQIEVIYEIDPEEEMFLPLISVSPDGIWLASMERRMKGDSEGPSEWTLKIISTKDGKTRELCKFFSVTNRSPFPRWSRDGRYIFFPGDRPGKEVTWDVWYVPVEGGEAKGLGLSLQRIGGISPHPDGKRLLFSSYGPTLNGPQVWVMENFLTQ